MRKSPMRISKRLSSAAFAAGALMLCATQAQAFDRSDCDRQFGAANIVQVSAFKMNAGNVDFGDNLHLFGAPQGDAVVCWSIDGRAAVIGRLYADDNREPLTAIAEVRFRRTNGAWTDRVKWTVTGMLAANGLTETASPLGRFDRANVRLSIFRDTALGPTTRVLKSINIRR